MDITPCDFGGLDAVSCLSVFHNPNSNYENTVYAHDSEREGFRCTETNLASALQHAQTRARKASHKLQRFETSLHCGVRSALHDLQQARDRVNHIRRVHASSPVSPSSARTECSDSKARPIRRTDSTPSLGVCYLEAREADAEMRDAQIRFRAVAEFAAPLILASASIEPCTDHDHYPILSFTGLTPPSLPASPPARSLCHRPTRSLSQESCLAALSFVPRPPAPSPTSAAMSTLLVLASSQPPQPSAISSSPSVPRAPPVLHTPLGSQVLHNRPFNALRDWSDEPEAEAKLLVPASLDSLTDELVRLNEIMAAACRPSGKSGRQLHPPTSIQSQPPSRTSPSTEQAVAMSAELEISAGAETEGANSAQRSRCTLASSSLFPVLSSPAPAASDDIRIRLNPERVNSGCSNAAQSASDLLSFSRDAVMVYSDDLSASLATASQCVDSGLAQEPPTRSLSMPNAPASYESLSSRIDPSQSTIVQHASGDARGDRHRLERELSEASPFAYEHVLGYHEVLEGCLVLESALADAKERLEDLEEKYREKSAEVEKLQASPVESCLRQLHHLNIVARSKLQQAYKIIHRLQLERTTSDQKQKTEFQCVRKTSCAASHSSLLKRILFQADESFFSRANFLYVLHLFFGVVLMISSYWKRITSWLGGRRKLAPSTAFAVILPD